jgi:hypothetical protein
LWAAEEAEQFDRGKLSTLLSQLAHLHQGKEYAADYDSGAKNLGHVGEAGQVIHGQLLGL